MVKKLERDLRAILRDEGRFRSSHITFTEFAKGGDAGAPDCWFTSGSHCHPLELKLGASVVKKLRPSQRRWHKDHLALGVHTYGASINGDIVMLFELQLYPGGILKELPLLTIAAEDFNCEHLHKILLG